MIDTRSDAIASVPIIRALHRHRLLHPVVTSTGQHREAVEPILALGGITVDHDLACVGEPSPNDLVAAIASQFERIECSHHPSALLVHADTTAAMAAAISAFHLGVAVVHLDGDRSPSSAPSAVLDATNRRIISELACLHLVTTSASARSAVSEGAPFDQVYVCGSTNIDTLRWAAALQRRPSDPAVAATAASADPLVVVVAHVDDDGTVDRIASGIATLAEPRPDTRFVVPMQPNAAGRRTIVAHLGDRPNVVLSELLPYAEVAGLLARADLLVTDSGPLQEAAPALHTPVLVAADGTDRTEGVEAGTIAVAGTDPDQLADRCERLLDDTPERQTMLASANPYGDGEAGTRIAAALGCLTDGSHDIPERFGPGFDRTSVMGGGRGAITNGLRFATAAR
jgi:UDP-N-acetylglucosamine 2-epimerase (non-hydrolysing)